MHRSILFGFIFAFFIGNYECYASEPFTEIYYKGNNWSVEKVGIKEEFHICTMISDYDYIENNQPQFGYLFLNILFPSKNIVFTGQNTGAYLNIVKHATISIDDKVSMVLIPEKPFVSDELLNEMIKGNTAKVNLDFVITIHQYTLTLLLDLQVHLIRLVSA